MPTLRTEAHAADRSAAAAPADPALAALGLKVPVRVAPSAIDGDGVFVLQAVAAGRKIGEIRGERIPAREARRRAAAGGRLFLVALNPRECVDASASAAPLRFANHSCAPSATYRLEQGRIAVYALRDLAAGEEVTLDYGATHHGGRLACRCGAPRCRGWL